MTPEKAALLEALAVERQHSPWWKTPEPPPDDELTQKYRRAVLDDAYKSDDDRTIRDGTRDTGAA
jgi:hypothetical protein